MLMQLVCIVYFRLYQNIDGVVPIRKDVIGMGKPTKEELSAVTVVVFAGSVVIFAVVLAIHAFTPLSIGSIILGMLAIIGVAAFIAFMMRSGKKLSILSGLFGAKLVLITGALYVIIMIDSFVALSARDLVLVLSAIVGVSLPVYALSWIGKKTSSKNRTLDQAQLTIDMPQPDLIGISDEDMPRVMQFIRAHPVNDHMIMRLIYVQRKKKVTLYVSQIGVGIVGVIMTVLALIAHGTEVRRQTAGDLTKRKSDDTYITEPIAPYGLIMLTILITVIVIWYLWLRWDSTFYILTSTHWMPAVSYPGWVYSFFTPKQTVVAVGSLDISTWSASFLGRLLRYGSNTSDTAAQNDAVIAIAGSLPYSTELLAAIANLQASRTGVQ